MAFKWHHTILVLHTVFVLAVGVYDEVKDQGELSLSLSYHHHHHHHSPRYVWEKVLEQNGPCGPFSTYLHTSSDYHGVKMVLKDHFAFLSKVGSRFNCFVLRLIWSVHILRNHFLQVPYGICHLTMLSICDRRTQQCLMAKCHKILNPH